MAKRKAQKAPASRKKPAAKVKGQEEKADLFSPDSLPNVSASQAPLPDAESVAEAMEEKPQPKKRYRPQQQIAQPETSSTRWKVWVPVIGVVFVLILLLMQLTGQQPSGGQKSTFMEKLALTAQTLERSFDFSNILTDLLTLIIIVTLWTAFKYWLIRVKYIEDQAKLLEELLIAVMLVIFINNHVVSGSDVGVFFGWVLFFGVLYLVLAGTWFFAKLVQQIPVTADWYAWLLRLAGALLIVFGVVMFTSTLGSIDLSLLSEYEHVFGTIYWVFSACLVLFGLLCIIRSFSTEPAP